MRLMRSSQGVFTTLLMIASTASASSLLPVQSGSLSLNEIERVLGIVSIDGSGSARALEGAKSWNIPSSHPDYAVKTVVESLLRDRLVEGANPSERLDQRINVIKTLENLLVKGSYSGLTDTSNSKAARLYIGTTGSFSLWRELSYLLLGRAYYEADELERAVHYYKGVSDTSRYYALAMLEMNWAYLKLKKSSNAQSNLGKLESIKERLSRDLQNEMQLQAAYLALVQQDTKQAALLAEGIKFTGLKGLRLLGQNSLETVRFKVLAQAWFDVYLSEVSQSSFEQKVKTLNKIASYVESVPAGARDQGLAVLATEVYWNLSSSYRVQDAVKYLSQSMQALNKANDWISPWVQRSIESGRPQLTEEAFFLSVAVLWEQENYKEVLPKLWALTKLYPQGKYREDAYQLLGDYYFEHGEHDRALEAYTQLAKVGSPQKAAYGVYKSAWSFYNKQEKWKALRHLERLVLHYRSVGDAKEDKMQGDLVKEAHQDLMIMLAEIMPHAAARKELAFFQYKPSEWIAAQEQLAHAYQKIGKYEDAVGMWRAILAENPGSEQSFDWMNELLSALLGLGRRDLLSKALDEFAPKLPGFESKSPAEKYSKLEKQISNVVLTVHKEARKTDDAAIWQSTDTLHQSFQKHFPDSVEGDVWFFGAQRHEQQRKVWEAVHWYQRAAEIEKYENRNDAALSTLRLIQQLTEKSDAKAVSQDDYVKIAKASKWYIDRFKKTPQRALAELQYLEALFHSRNYDEASRYLVDSVKEEGFTKEHIDQYLSFNHRLYKDKLWDVVYDLAGDLLKDSIEASLKAKDGKPLASTIKSIRQESAFQAAFEQQEKKTDVVKLRHWYKRAIEADADPLVTLKAWHNMLLSYAVPKEADEFVSEFKRFKSVVNIEAAQKLDAERSKLMFEAFGRASEVFEAISEPIERARALSLAAGYSANPEQHEALLWESLLLHGSFYNYPELQAVTAKFLQTQAGANKEKRLTIARLHFLNGDFQGAWKQAQALANQEPSVPAVWVLVRDLYDRAGADEDKAGPQIAAYLKKNYQHLKSNSLLASIWVKVLHSNPKEVIKVSSTLTEGRSPASTKSTGSEVQDKLKQRVEQVGQALRLLETQKQELKKFISSALPQVSVEAVCRAPTLSGKAASSLERLKEPAIASPQWKDFLAKLSSKVDEIKKIERQERDLCEKQRDDLAYLPPLETGEKKLASALCSDEKCFPEKYETDSDQVVKAQKNAKQNKLSGLALVQRYLDIGAWATAEAAAHSASSVAERSLLLGYIRLAYGDPWNAVSLLREAEKSKKYRSHAKLFLARMAWRHGRPKTARAEFEAVQVSELQDWEMELYKELKAGFRS
ncbi:MAG: hypothetical protein AB1540_06290 [Bdellovibrionota bacterium]